MNPILKAGTRIVVLALLSYSIAILTEQRKKIVSRTVLLFLSLGVLLDITATACMIIGSPNSPFTAHGFLGYSALLAMLIDCSLIVKARLAHGTDAAVNRGLHLYSRYAYFWWVLAFVTGSVMVMMK